MSASAGRAMSLLAAKRKIRSLAMPNFRFRLGSQWCHRCCAPYPSGVLTGRPLSEAAHSPRPEVADAARGGGRAGRRASAAAQAERSVTGYRVRDPRAPAVTMATPIDAAADDDMLS